MKMTLSFATTFSLPDSGNDLRSPELVTVRFAAIDKLTKRPRLCSVGLEHLISGNDQIGYFLDLKVVEFLLQTGGSDIYTRVLRSLRTLVGSYACHSPACAIALVVIRGAIRSHDQFSSKTTCDVPLRIPNQDSAPAQTLVNPLLIPWMTF